MTAQLPVPDAVEAGRIAHRIYSAVMENAEYVHNNAIEANEAESILTAVMGRTRYYLAVNSRELEKLWKRIRENPIATDLLHIALVQWNLHYPNMWSLVEQAAAALSFNYGFDAEGKSNTVCDSTFVDSNSDYPTTVAMLNENQWFLFLYYVNVGLWDRLMYLSEEAK